MADVPTAAPLSFNADIYRKLFPQEYLKTCINNDVRPDSRKFDAARAVHIQTNVIQTASSSSLVRVGSTSVIAAVKLAVGTPAVATPDQGEIAVQVHLTPLCSTRFNLGRPSEEAQSLGSQLMRIITGARVVEMSDLSIEAGKSAWKLLVDVYCIDHDGNVHDASLIAVMAALKTLQLPAVVINEADHIVTVQPDGDATPLKLQDSVYGTTFAVLNGRVVIDPTSEEETLSSSIFSITYNTQQQLAGVHKPGGEVLAPQTLHGCMAVAKDRAVQLAAMVDAALAPSTRRHSVLLLMSFFLSLLGTRSTRSKQKKSKRVTRPPFQSASDGDPFRSALIALSLPAWSDHFRNSLVASSSNFHRPMNETTPLWHASPSVAAMQSGARSPRHYCRPPSSSAMNMTRRARLALIVAIAIVGVTTLSLLVFSSSFSAEEITPPPPTLRLQRSGHSVREDDAADSSDDLVTFVPGFGTPLETQYAGLVTVNHEAVGKLFYWFFEARMDTAVDTSTPLIVWLNGGPGASSMTGLLTENGPYRITSDGKLIPHDYAWTRLGHMLFFDQPVGTGYGSVRDDNGYVTSQDEVATQFYSGLQAFFALHPEYALNPLYICGESYAGKYVPSIAHYIHMQNAAFATNREPGEIRLNLHGVAVGNGIMWPVLQTRSVPDFAIALGLIDSQQYEKANADISVCEELHRQGRHIDAFQICQAVSDQIMQNAGNPFVYDVRKSGNPFNDLTTALSKYFNDDTVRRALHVPVGTPWSSIDGGSYGTSATAPALVRHLQNDAMLDVPIDTFRDLLDNYNFLFYAGNMDGSACNNLGVGRMIDRLAWSATSDYRVAQRQPWIVNGNVAGLAKSAGNMSYVVVTNAGHLVPTDQPEAALDMMRRFLNSEPFSP